MTAEPRTFSRRNFILAAAALALGGCAKRESILPEFDPTKIGAPKGGDKSAEIKKQEKELEDEVKNHKLSNEEQYIKANLTEEYDQVRAFCNEEGQPVKDFMEGYYTRQDDKIYVNFFQKPIHEHEIGSRSIARVHYRYFMVPLEKAFLISRIIRQEWNEQNKAERTAHDAKVFTRTLREQAEWNGQVREMNDTHAVKDAETFLGLPPSPKPRRILNRSNTPNAL